jgi:transposase InsO family protein
MTDSGACYKSHLYHDTLEAAGIVHVRIPPRQPQINGKVERFNRTLLEEWAYVRVYRSEQERIDALADWIHTYNHHRNHTAIGGPPISRVHNLAGQHSPGHEIGSSRGGGLVLRSSPVICAPDLEGTPAAPLSN